MQRRPRLVGILWRWHRRLGLLAALFVLVLAATGIVLNHTSALGLDHRFVKWSWLRHVYGDRSGELRAFQVNSHWVARAGDGRVYFDSIEVSGCRGQLVGAAQAADFIYAGCAEELLLLTDTGELVESVTASTGLPTPLTAIGRIDSRVALQAGKGWWLADLEQMDFSAPVPAGAVIRQLAPGILPESMQRTIPARDAWLSWERVLLDLHSGRLFGSFGVVLMDAVGVLLGGLALSGVAIWWLHRRRSRRD